MLFYVLCKFHELRYLSASDAHESVSTRYFGSPHASCSPKTCTPRLFYLPLLKKAFILSVDSLLSFSLEVLEARKKSKPIVSLESTVLTHGLSWPHNYELYKDLDEIIRSYGAIPACIAVMDGQVKVGLSHEEVKILSQKGPSLYKVSSYDLPFVLAQKKSAGTTVAATLALSEKAEILVVATGGIGGVHRNFSKLPDVSHDLESLCRYSCLLVCAGAKSILDLEATWETLETKGVLSVGFNCDEFPAFYSQKSGIKLNYRVDDCRSLWKIYEKMEKGCLLVLNPIAKKDSIAKEEVDLYVEQALLKAHEEKIRGKNLTPFLLAYLNQCFGAKLLAANLALLRQNVELAAKIACQRG